MSRERQARDGALVRLVPGRQEIAVSHPFVLAREIGLLIAHNGTAAPQASAL